MFVYRSCFFFVCFLSADGIFTLFLSAANLGLIFFVCVSTFLDHLFTINLTYIDLWFNYRLIIVQRAIICMVYNLIKHGCVFYLYVNVCAYEDRRCECYLSCFFFVFCVLGSVCRCVIGIDCSLKE